MADLYDSVPYPGSAFQDTHPDRLGTLAFLHGMNPAPTEQCRVLELGAGNGGNLIPHAWLHPESTFLGLDRAGTAVAVGNAMIDALGLRNVRLETVDLLDVSTPLGEFDYIIAHGVFSWVPDAVRRAILRICQQNLAPDGVAFISYLALPGTHLRNVFRDAMLFHVRGRVEAADRVRQARAIVQLIADMPGDDPYRDFARSLLSELNRAEDSVLFHDYLADINAPLYFMQFVELAAQYGLQFLSEAEYPAMFFDLEKADENVKAAIEQLQSNPILREQYFDFLRCRRFRQTLLVRSTAEVVRPVRLERLLSLHVASALESPAEHAPGVDGIEQFTRKQTGYVQTDHAVGKAALRRLAGIWPATLPVRELLDDARAATNSQDPLEKDTDALLEILHRCYQLGHVEFWRSPTRLAPGAGERPVLSPVARYQLRRGRSVSTLKHLTMEVQEPLSAALMRLLDGTRDRAALVTALAKEVVSERLPLEPGGPAITDEAEARAQVASRLEEHLRQIARAGLLVD